MKIGDILYVKVTGEPISFLRFAEGREDAVIVRRPRETRLEGLVHEEEFWYLAELETFEERITRSYQEFKLQEKLKSALKEHDTSTEVGPSEVVQ